MDNETKSKNVSSKGTTLETNASASINMLSVERQWVNIGHDSSTSSSRIPSFDTPEDRLSGVIISETYGSSVTSLSSGSIAANLTPTSEVEESISPTCTLSGQERKPKLKGRKGHTKSRRGCYNCKRARIKVFASPTTLPMFLFIPCL